jgi:SIR2-like domain
VEAESDLEPLRSPPFSEAISAFEDLMAQGGRAFLIGAGCSRCAGLPLIVELTEAVLTDEKLNAPAKAILEGLKLRFEGAAAANVEDYLSELIDLLASADRRAARGAADADAVLGANHYSAEALRDAATSIKEAIGRAVGCEVAIETHRSFVGAVHRPLRPGKPPGGEPVGYLVLNYDTLIEDALALERVPYADGIDGGASGWWNAATFDRQDLAALVLKLHGSIDWREIDGDRLPRRLARSIPPVGGAGGGILIWPASTKYRETQFDPYAQLMDRARQLLRPDVGSQRVLVVCGYSFGDAHINIELERALQDSDGRLTVVVFTSDNVPTGDLGKWLLDPEIGEQILVFAKRGFFTGKTHTRPNKTFLGGSSKSSHVS